MARPLKDVDESLVEKLAALHCTMKEIAAVVECSVDTLERRFMDLIAKGREKGKSKLRRLQWAAAEKGNVAMLIFLGKQYLDQSDKVDPTNSVVVTGDVQVTSMTKEQAKAELAKRRKKDGSS